MRSARTLPGSTDKSTSSQLVLLSFTELVAADAAPYTVAGMEDRTRADILFNCTGTDVFILVDGERVKLPSAPSPTILEGHGNESALEISVSPGGAATTLRVQGSEPQGSLSLPAVMPGAVYLVRPEILLRFPHRRDFVVPSAYSLEVGPTGSTRMRSTLVEVRRTLPVVDRDAPNISLE